MYNNEKITKITNNKKNPKKGRRFFFIPLKESDRILSATEKKYFKILNGELIVNVLFIILGIIFYFINFGINIWLSFIFIIYGLIKIWAFTLKNDISLFTYSICYAVVSFIISIITFFNINSNIILGIWLIFMVIENAELVLRLKLIEEKSWNYILMVSIISLFMSILLLINPLNNLSFNQIMASFLILYGVLNSSKIFMLKSRSYNFV